MSSQGLGLNISYWQPSLHFYKHLSIFQPDPTRTKIKFKSHNHIQGYLKTKGGRLKNKLWCCIGGEYYIGHRKEFLKQRFRALALRQSE